MNPEIHPDNNDEMRPEYDFSAGVRSKHSQAYRAGTNVVWLEPDIAACFPIQPRSTSENSRTVVTFA